MKKAAVVTMLAVVALAVSTFGIGLHSPITFSSTTSSGGGGGGGGGDSCTGCTNETFEGTGYALTGWSESGSIVNEDYATAPAPIAGSQSLLIKNAAFSGDYSEKHGANVTESWLRVAIVCTNAVPTGLAVCSIADSTGGNQAIVSIQGAKLRITCGSATADTATSIVANKTNYVWLHYLKGSGANAVADVGFSEHPTKTRPTSGGNFAQVTSGTSTANAEIWRLGGGDYTFSVGVVGGIIFDTMSGSTTGSIGDFP